MKLLYLTKAILLARAQVVPCQNNYDCNYVVVDGTGPFWNGGCCNMWTAVDWGTSEDAQGQLGENWKTFTDTDKLTEGSSFMGCMPAGYNSDSEADMISGSTNNYADLTNFLKVAPELLLKDPTKPDGEKYENLDAWIVGNGSTVDAQKDFTLKVGCIKDTDFDKNPLALIPCNPEMAGGTDGCEVAPGTCCNTWEATGFPDEPDKVMGVFGINWKFYAKVEKGKGFEAGQKFSGCVPQAYADDTMEDLSVTGETNNWNDLTNFADALEGTELAILGDGDKQFKDMTDWVTKMGSSQVAQAAFTLKVGCNMADKLALSGMMAVASVLALM